MKTSRQKVLDIFNRKNTDDKAFWTGHPNDATIPIFAREWGIEPTREAIYNFLDDDCRWIVADSGYKHPEGLPAFDPPMVWTGNPECSRVLCRAEDVKDIENTLAQPGLLRLYRSIPEIDRHQDKAIFTGMWSPFSI